MTRGEPGGERASLVGVGAFTLAYMGAALAGAMATGNREFLFYFVIMVVLVGCVLAVHRVVGLTAGLLWGLSVWGLLHMAGGLVPVPAGWPINGDIRVLYSLWLVPGLLKFDHVVHFYGFGITTWLCWQGMCATIRRAGGTPAPTAGLMILSAAAGMGFGALNEVVEFVATLALPETNVGGYINTGWDLVSNFAGSATAALMIWLCGRKGG